MKAVILAAGKGVRMMPLTQDLPKVLVEVGGKPFLHYVIKSLQKAGYDDLCLIVGYKSEKIKEFLKKNKIKATVIQQEQQKGTGDAVMHSKTFAGKENFIVLGGDNLWSVEDLKLMNKDDDYNYISGIKVQNPEKYGVLIEEKGFLKEIKEKPKENYGNLINTGLYKFTPEIFEALTKIKLSPRGEYELTDAITTLARQKKVKLIKIKDFWRDLGTIQDIAPMEKFLKERWHE